MTYLCMISCLLYTIIICYGLKAPLTNRNYNNVYNRCTTQVCLYSSKYDTSTNTFHSNNNNVTAYTNVNRNNTTRSSIENVGLFAAGDVKAYSSPLSNSIYSARASASYDNQLPGGYRSMSNRTNIQIEILLLEAEREKLIMDQERLLLEKKKLIAIDNLITKMIHVNVSYDTSAFTSLINSNKLVISKDLFFRIIELTNWVDGKSDPATKQRLTTLNDDIMSILSKDDPPLHAQLLSEIQVELNQELNRFRSIQRSKGDETLKVYDNALMEWIDQQNNDLPNKVNASILMDPSGILTNFNMTDVMMKSNRTMLKFPSALPVNMLPLILRSPEISIANIDIIKSEIFTDELLDNSIADYSSFIVTLRGKVFSDDTRYSSLEKVYEEMNKRINANPSLKDTVQLFLLPEYRIQDEMNIVVEKHNSGSKFEPVFMLLSKQVKPRGSDLSSVAFSFMSLIVSMITSFVYATDVNSLNKNFIDQAMAGDESVVSRVIPIIIGIIGLQLAHDLGHYIVAAIQRLKISIPFIVPSIESGIFGSVTNLLDFPKSRSQLFDVSIAGPIVGFLASLACTVYGFQLTQTAAPDLIATFPELPVSYFQASYLFAQLGEMYLNLGVENAAIGSSLVPVHPLIVIGFTGLLTNAFNFLPIGRLDGGRAIMAIGGRDTANSISLIVSLLQVATILFGQTSAPFLFWSLFVLFLQRSADIPPLDDVSPISERNILISGVRASSLLIAIVLTIAVLLPQPLAATVSSGILL